jgi:glycine/D-amino acid oxidase-like deaminating enzyme
MLARARDHGLELVVDEVTRIEVADGKVSGVGLRSGGEIRSGIVVDAGGPMSAAIAEMAGIALPLFSELHLKVAYRDHLAVLPRDAPMIIWSDTQRIDWDQEEREALEELGRHELLGRMPIFCHGRPEGGADSPFVVALWEYHGRVQEPTWPLLDDPLYPEVVMRGLATMVPGLDVYANRLPESSVDGGYYTKTAENRPLIGPAGPRGFHLIAGLSGFGVMVAAGAGELLASHIVGHEPPPYADAFLLSRYEDPEYVSSVATKAPSGQL